MSSKVQIANRALQMCGVAKRLTTFEDNGQEGRAIRTCWDSLLRAELKQNIWTFTIKRATISAETASPAFDKQFQYQLPHDFVRKAPRTPKARQYADDWDIEGGKILTDDAGPIFLRYVAWDVDEALWDDIFNEGLAARIAHQIVEELTQSGAKKEGLASDYIKFIGDARRAGSIEHGPIQPTIDSWEAVRGGGTGRSYPQWWSG